MATEPVTVTIEVDAGPALDSLELLAARVRALETRQRIARLAEALPKVEPIVLPGTFVWGSVVANA